jgi:hypothetical protein
MNLGLCKIGKLCCEFDLFGLYSRGLKARSGVNFLLQTLSFSYREPETLVIRANLLRLDLDKAVSFSVQFPDETWDRLAKITTSIKGRYYVYSHKQFLKLTDCSLLFLTFSLQQLLPWHNSNLRSYTPAIQLSKMPFCLTLGFILAISLAGVVHAGSSCVAFDMNWNLLAFGFNGKDYNAGTLDTWTTGALKPCLFSVVADVATYTRHCDGYYHLRPAVSETLNYTF